MSHTFGRKTTSLTIYIIALYLLLPYMQGAAAAAAAANSGCGCSKGCSSSAE
jgi:hypothetical protein